MEYSRCSVLILHMNIHFFCSNSNRNASKVKHLFHKIAFWLYNLSLAFNNDIISITYFHYQLFIFWFWTFRSKCNLTHWVFSGFNFVFKRAWNKHPWFWCFPSKFCSSISIVCYLELLGYKHVKIVFRESEL